MFYFVSTSHVVINPVAVVRIRLRLYLSIALCNNRRRSPKSSSTNEEMKTEEVVYEQVNDKVPKKLEKGNESYVIANMH